MRGKAGRREKAWTRTSRTPLTCQGRYRTMVTRRSLLLASLAVLVSPVALYAADPPAGPAYQIVLRSRHAEATPTRSKDAQTGGGAIVVEQPEPNTLVVTMTGSAVAG